MSHVAKIDIHIKDLAALKLACKDLGLVFNENQTTYKWYGRHVGDYPLPQGFKANELGKCQHAISIVPDAKKNPNAYEVGVVARRDGKPGFTLLWDFYRGGYGLEEKIGKDANKLKQRYATHAAMRAARKQGLRVTETIQTGQVKLVCSR